MPHKYTREDTIRRLEEDLAVAEASIRRAKIISVGDRDSFQTLKEQIKDFLESSRIKKNNSLDFLERDESNRFFNGESQQKIAYLNRGEERAFEVVLDLMENPQNSISYYEEQRKRAEEDLKRYKSYEQRPAEPIV